MRTRAETSQYISRARSITRCLIGLVAGLALVWLPAEAVGQGVQFENASSGESGTQTSSFSFSHTVNSGNDLILIVGGIIRSSSSSFTSVTYNGLELTRIDSITGGGDAHAELWYLLDPPVGTFDVTLNSSDSRNLAGGAMTLSGVEQVAPSGAATAGGQGDSTSVTVSSEAFGMVVDVVNQRDPGGTLGSLTVGPDQTERYRVDHTNTAMRAAGSTEPGASSVTMSWSFTGDPRYAQVAVPLSPSITPTISSADNQIFVVGDPATTAETITIIDDDNSPTITAANDIRIRIPGGFNMVWDNTVTGVTLGGNAASKVSSTLLPYEDADQTVVLDVTSDFAASDTLTIDGLVFTSFTDASAADNLELEVHNDGTVAALDDKTIEILAQTYDVAVTPDGLASPLLRQAGTDYSQDFTVTNNSAVQEDFDLLGRTEPSSSFLTIDSITGANVSQGSDPDSARLSSLAAGDSATVSLWYTVSSSTDGRVDTLYLTARSVSESTVSDDGHAEIEFEPPVCDGSGAGGGNGNIIVEAVTCGVDSGVGSLTVSHTTSGSDRLMIVAVSFNNNSDETVSSVTYDGVSLSLVGAEQASNDSRVEMWQLVAPNTGTHDVVVNLSSTLCADCGVTVAAITFTGVNQSDPLGPFASAFGGTSPATVDVSSASDELVLDAVACEGSCGPITVGSGQTERWNPDPAPGSGSRVEYAGGSTEPGAATVTMSWSLDAADDWAIGGVSIKPTAPAPDLSSAANQTFVVGDPATTAETITIIDDASSATITAANDLRIRIPGGFNMVWDATVTDVTLGGNAASKVSSTLLPYEDADGTVVLDVTTDFAASDTLTIDGLAFTDFTDASAADNLELEVNNDDVVSAEDDKTIEIVAESFAVSVIPDTTTASRLPSNGTNYTVVFTVINNGNGFEDYDLLTTKNPGTVITVVSITGSGITQDANPDSARLADLAPGDSADATVTYSVADVAAGSTDTLVFTARSVADPTTTDDGRLELTVVRPSMTTAKAVDPTGTQPPGTDLSYTITFANDGSADAVNVVIVDTLPTEVQFKMNSVTENLPSGISVTVEYSDDGGSTWTYTPSDGGCGAPAGYDACVTHIRWTLQSNLTSASPDNTGDVGFIAQIK